jgi:hypothetical protein
MAFLEGIAEAVHVAEVFHTAFEQADAINRDNPGKALAHLADEKMNDAGDHIVPGMGVIRRVLDGGNESKGGVETLFDGLF